MNKLFIISITVLFFSSMAIAHPAYRKEFDKIINSNDCLKSCMTNLTKFDEEISLMKNPNLQRYFGKIDDICALISSTRECIDACKIESNPFALDSVNVICEPSIKEKIDKVNDCFASKSTESDIYGSCASACGDYNAVNNEVHHLTQSIQESELKDNGKVNPIMEKTNQACGIFKCMAKCNVENLKDQCGKEAADDVQGILQRIFDTHYHDLQKLNIVSTMSKTIPPECSYMWDPTVIFGHEETTQATEVAETKSSNLQDLLPRIQLELLLKQLKLADKQEDLIQRETQKLDMEMDLLSQKLNHPKSHQQQQQQQFTKSLEESRFFL